MRINVAIPEAHVSAPVLDAALEATTRLNEAMLRKGEIPSFEQGLSRGVRWRPEPQGEEHFDHAAEVLKRGWGDCDDLSPWHAASLRHSGEDPDAYAVVRRSGPSRWHAIVRRGDGSIDDPSREAGMRAGIAPGVYGASLPLMYVPPSSVVGGGAYLIKPAIAMRPWRGQWQGRADIPWMWQEHMTDYPTASDYAMVTLHNDPVASTALTGAIDGACKLAMAAGYADPSHIDRLCALADACNGWPYEKLVEVYGEEHARAAQQVVGSFFKKLGKIAKGALKVARTAVKYSPLGLTVKLTEKIPGMKYLAPGIKFIPAIGPVADTTIQVVEKIMEEHGHHFIPAAPPPPPPEYVAPHYPPPRYVAPPPPPPPPEAESSWPEITDDVDLSTLPEPEEVPPPSPEYEYIPPPMAAPYVVPPPPPVQPVFYDGGRPIYLARPDLERHEAERREAQRHEAEQRAIAERHQSDLREAERRESERRPLEQRPVEQRPFQQRPAPQWRTGRVPLIH